MEIEKTLPKKVQRTLAKTRKMAEKQAQKIRATEHAELCKVADEFLKTLTEIVNECVFLHDIEGLDLLVSQVHMVQDHRVLQVLRNKGFSKEITDLCDKAGRGEH